MTITSHMQKIIQIYPCLLKLSRKILVFGWKITDFENYVLLHRDGGIIDHIYIRGLHSVQSGVLPVYYSDHAAIYSILQ
jgi:endonuclease/exonuclease/phosphatase (EEP) superfamily protein YafD